MIIKFKTFENKNIDIDPFGEENWGDNKFENGDMVTLTYGWREFVVNMVNSGVEWSKWIMSSGFVMVPDARRAWRLRRALSAPDIDYLSRLYGIKLIILSGPTFFDGKEYYKVYAPKAAEKWKVVFNACSEFLIHTD